MFRETAKRFNNTKGILDSFDQHLKYHFLSSKEKRTSIMTIRIRCYDWLPQPKQQRMGVPHALQN